MASRFNYPYLTAFEEYARQEIMDSSIESYHKYLKGLNENLFTRFSDKESPFAVITRDSLENNSEDVLTALSEWQDIIDGEISNPDLLQSYSEKTIRNWRSGFSKYVEFIEYLIENGGYEDEDFGAYEPTVIKPKRTKAKASSRGPLRTKKSAKLAQKDIGSKTLDEKIKRCLRGQDRFSPNRETNLPINYISQILNLDPSHKKGQDFINDWTRHNKANVKALVLTESGQDIEIPASSIVKLNIYGKEKPVEVIYGKNKTGILRTRKAIDDNELENMYLENSSQLHIDHEPSVARILEDIGDNQKLLPALARVSQIVKEVAKKLKIEKIQTHDAKIAKALTSDHKIVSEIQGLLEDIRKELQLFDSKVVRLEFMYGPNNIAKGKG